MLRKKSTYLLLATLAIGSTQAQAQTPLAVGVDAGTNGLGLVIHGGITETINLRAGYNYFDISQDVDADNNDGVEGNELRYSGDLELSNLSLIGDWYPWGGTFHVSLGAVLNNNDLTVDAECNNAAGCEVGEDGDSFVPSQLGTITTDVDFEDYGPYLGIGWGNPVGGETGLRWRFEIGAIYQGAPTVSMRSNGDCGLFATACRQALQDEEEELEDDLSSLKWYPVAQVGLSYRFR
ncbi:MAG: hypothetical protein R3352_03455 [Salinisphaeraceae bacterium]|nr:hypothetical protein [Salinisphaeraceae bacterium]